MKCGYCGKKTAGNAPYCSAYCQKKAAAQQKQSHTTRIPFLVLEIIALAAALIAILMMFAEKANEGFLLLSGAFAVSGITMLAFPRHGKTARAFCQIGGSVLFALAVAIFMLWR